jgi:dipeptidyl aminopeptidase/acylaminoacyl peptidase
VLQVVGALDLAIIAQLAGRAFEDDLACFQHVSAVCDGEGGASVLLDQENGQSIAFASNRDGGQWRIYVMNADGTNARRLSSGPMDLTPTWSPDGNWIAFASTRGGQFDIWMVDIHGGNLTQITKTGGDHPSWTR